MSKVNYKHLIDGFYNNYIEYNDDFDSPDIVAWSSKEAQYQRFEALWGIGINSNDTILDLGCGAGHLTDFLIEKKYDLKKYTGLDINQNFIDISKKRRPEVKFLTGEIFDLKEKFDYVIGSGVFSVMMEIWEVMEAIQHAYNISNKGVAFNFLTLDYINEFWVNSYEPIDFYRAISKKYENVTLITDYYGNEDFTIFIKK